jgi:hypothetical protein
MAIDCIYISIDVQTRTANIVPVQITTANQHSHSERNFHQNAWAQVLINGNYTIKVTFVWITEDGKTVEDLERKQHKTRSLDTGAAISLCPRYTSSLLRAWKQCGVRLPMSDRYQYQAPVAGDLFTSRVRGHARRIFQRMAARLCFTCNPPSYFVQNMWRERSINTIAIASAQANKT